MRGEGGALGSRLSPRSAYTVCVPAGVVTSTLGPAYTGGACVSLTTSQGAALRTLLWAPLTLPSTRRAVGVIRLRLAVLPPVVGVGQLDGVNWFSPTSGRSGFAPFSLLFAPATLVGTDNALHAQFEVRQRRVNSIFVSSPN